MVESHYTFELQREHGADLGTVSVIEARIDELRHDGWHGPITIYNGIDKNEQVMLRYPADGEGEPTDMVLLTITFTRT